MSCNRSDRSRNVRMLRRSPRTAAFTFIELMVVIVIIGLLAASVGLATRHFLDRAKQTRARADIATYKSALEAYYADASGYPSNDDGLGALAAKYVDKLRNDPWGRPYQYNAPGRAGPYEVVCLGADGREGGEGADADLSSEDGDAVEQAKR